MQKGAPLLPLALLHTYPLTDDSLLFCLCSCAFLRGSNEVIPFTAFTFRQVAAGRNAGIRVIGAIIIIIFPVHLKSLHLKKCIIKLPTLTRLLSLSDGCLLSGFHLLHAITANDVHGFCGSYALVTAGANIFAGAARLFGLGCGSIVRSFGQRSDYIPQADRLAHLKVLPACSSMKSSRGSPGLVIVHPYFGCFSTQSPWLSAIALYFRLW